MTRRRCTSPRSSGSPRKATQKSPAPVREYYEEEGNDENLEGEESFRRVNDSFSESSYAHFPNLLTAELQTSRKEGVIHRSSVTQRVESPRVYATPDRGAHGSKGEDSGRML